MKYFVKARTTVRKSHIDYFEAHLQEEHLQLSTALLLQPQDSLQSWQPHLDWQSQGLPCLLLHWVVCSIVESLLG